jgi:hypothetical protein
MKVTRTWLIKFVKFAWQLELEMVLPMLKNFWMPMELK